jgi:hypothetical protein
MDNSSLYFANISVRKSPESISNFRRVYEFMLPYHITASLSISGNV